MDLSQVSTADLKKTLARIPKEIERRQQAEKAQLLQEMEALARARGFITLGEVIDGYKKIEGTPLPIKYRHPSNEKLTWTGRGRQPKWIQDFVQGGGNLDALKAA